MTTNKCRGARRIHKEEKNLIRQCLVSFRVCLHFASFRFVCTHFVADKLWMAPKLSSSTIRLENSTRGDERRRKLAPQPSSSGIQFSF